MARAVDKPLISYAKIKHFMRKRGLTVRALHTKFCKKLRKKKRELSEPYFYELIRGDKWIISTSHHTGAVSTTYHKAG